MSSRPRARWLGVGHALDAAVEAPYLLAFSTPGLRLVDARLVGPFALAELASTWEQATRDFHEVGAFFVVLARRMGDAFDAFDVERERDAAREILEAIPYFTTGAFEPMRGFFVASLDAKGMVVLTADGRMPAFDDEAAARRGLRSKRTKGPGVVVEALLGRGWYIQMG